ncbi:hypothetical protein BDZ45DRAFT_733863 [Acephala macrosclerotiorum]|nr:hypothetical protein BDZ45DRAFT_733863 [Acephala macrosclerotiorum]
MVADAFEKRFNECDIDGFNIAYISNPGSYEDVVELLDPELQKRGPMWSDYHVPGRAFRENLQNRPGQPHLGKDHPGYQFYLKLPYLLSTLAFLKVCQKSYVSVRPVSISSQTEILALKLIRHRRPMKETLCYALIFFELENASSAPHYMSPLFRLGVDVRKCAGSYAAIRRSLFVENGCGWKLECFCASRQNSS